MPRSVESEAFILSVVPPFCGDRLRSGPFIMNWRPLVTTHETQQENNDVDATVVEHHTPSATDTTSTPLEGPARPGDDVEPLNEASGADFNSFTSPQSGDNNAPADTPPAETQVDAQSENSTSQEMEPPTFASDNPPAQATDKVDEASNDEHSTPAPEPAEQVSAEEATFPTPEAPPVIEESEVRPFTDFIEEFRQAEARLSSALQEEPSPLLSVEELPVPELTIPWEQILPLAPFALMEDVEVQSIEATESTYELAETSQTAVDRPDISATDTDIAFFGDAPVAPLTEPAAPTERPVSPLLRPASRIRLPHHRIGRQREEWPVEEAAQVETPESTSVAEPAPVTEEQPKPARRYRFDRPANTSVSSPAPASVRNEEHKEVLNRATSSAPARTDNGQSTGAQPVSPASSQGASAPQTPPPEQGTLKQPGIQEMPSIEAETTGESDTASMAGKAAPEHDRRRPHKQDRHRDKEQAASTTPATPVADVGTQFTAPVSTPTAAESATPPQGEVSPEDLPPLEYAELQAASSRRRRRRRGNATTPAANPLAGVKPVSPETPASPEASVAPPPTPMPTASPSVSMPRIPAGAAGQYNIISGHTVNQMNQAGEGPGPFMGPEPSPARGSTIAREGRPLRAEVQRAPSYPSRSTESAPSSSSMHHLANVVSQAIQAQTDRMVAELRRANQSPTNISVSLPPFPSNERVGVFVDVANLLYSARTLRMTVDFGKLLDFLRGNRRLVRAHAYCPTSPQPGDEQMFLQAVKGLGYRITTKNYKTFSSGAKKADLDLDLCMDVVRLVDGKAVDCIVLVSGDSDFMPMLDYCSDHGVRVEVAAFDEAMSATLRQSCDLFINLSMLEEIRA